MGVVGWRVMQFSVFMYTTLFIVKTLQYRIITDNNIMLTSIGVSMVENNLTSMDDQNIGVIDLIFVKVFFMLNTDMCFISGIF